MTRILAIITAATIGVILTIGLTGCGGPCSDHGGIRQYVGSGVYVCNDGHWV